MKRVSPELVDAINLAKKEHKEKFGMNISDVAATEMIANVFKKKPFLNNDDDDNVGIFK